ncbi:MAG: galacturonokinase [Candidatus Latescibacterota bacterium]|jgi:galacturonokinase
MSNIIDQLNTEMYTRFGIQSSDVQIVRSPYRICPLGAHIDHQLGSVTAMAIDQAVYLAFAPSGNSQMQLQSLTFDGNVQFDLNTVPDKQDSDWGNYPRGAVRALQDQGHTLTQGILGLSAGKMNEGGLSSSAAIGVAFLLALEQANNIAVTPEENIRLDQAIENGYLGLKNGILDQSAILLSRNNHLTLIDCESASYELIPKSQSMPPFDILVAQSGLKEALVGTGYNTRVDECAQAAGILLEAIGRIDQKPLLGNITSEEYDTHKNKLSGDVAKRAQHFFSESARVQQGIEAWRTGDLNTFGRLISESGYSSVHNYECGSKPLIDLYHILIETDGVYGARFSGAGFRGCCVALVDPSKSAAALKHIHTQYQQKHPDLAQNASSFTCQPDDGARIL